MNSKLHLVTDTTDADKKSKELCLQGVQLAEANKLDEALEYLNKGIEVAPERAPGYNDRAQLFRLMKRDDGIFYGLIYKIYEHQMHKTKVHIGLRITSYLSSVNKSISSHT